MCVLDQAARGRTGSRRSRRFSYLDREVAILRRTLPGLDERLAQQVAEAVRKMRGLDLLKPPGVAESLDWARALQALGRTEPDVATLGAVLKYREDADRVIGSTIVG